MKHSYQKDETIKNQKLDQRNKQLLRCSEKSRFNLILKNYKQSVIGASN